MNLTTDVKIALSFCKTCQIITLQRNKTINFLEYWYTVVFVHDISCPSKQCLVHCRNMHEISEALNLTVICIASLTCKAQPFQYPF